MSPSPKNKLAHCDTRWVARDRLKDSSISRSLEWKAVFQGSGEKDGEKVDTAQLDRPSFWPRSPCLAVQLCILETVKCAR